MINESNATRLVVEYGTYNLIGLELKLHIASWHADLELDRFHFPGHCRPPPWHPTSYAILALRLPYSCPNIWHAAGSRDSILQAWTGTKMRPDCHIPTRRRRRQGPRKIQYEPPCFGGIPSSSSSSDCAEPQPDISTHRK